MFMKRARIRLAAWVACLAILAGSLAPTVSHVLAAARGGDAAWIDVCANDGAKTVRVKGDLAIPSPAQNDSHVPLAHCPYCLTHAGSFAIAAQPGLVISAAVDGTALPSGFQPSPRPAFAGAATHSRAPPALS